MKKIAITAADGYVLSALYATPVDRSQNTVIISSATGIRKEYYSAFATCLVRNGYNVLLYDYRGIGGSAPEDLRKSQAYMHEWGTHDMNAALDYMVNERGHTSITWLGHSVGGQLVPLLHQKQHIKKVIALNAALGYWGYFPFPKNLQVWALWHIVQPLMIRWYGYGNMKKIGWGENLPANILVEWKEWCINRNFYQEYFRSSGQHNRLDDFRVPLTAVYTSDDYIANDKTVPLMLQFFPNSPKKIRKLAVEQYTREKVGHIGIFRKKFENTLWPVLVDIIDN